MRGRAFTIAIVVEVSKFAGMCDPEKMNTETSDESLEWRKVARKKMCEKRVF